MFPRYLTLLWCVQQSSHDDISVILKELTPPCEGGYVPPFPTAIIDAMLLAREYEALITNSYFDAPTCNNDSPLVLGFTM